MLKREKERGVIVVFLLFAKNECVYVVVSHKTIDVYSIELLVVNKKIWTYGRAKTFHFEITAENIFGTNNIQSRNKDRAPLSRE
jgi:hypothetical protein